MQVEQVVELYWGACAQPRDPEGHPGEGLSWGGSLKLGLPDGFWFLGPLRGKWWSTSFRDFSHYILSGTFPFLSLCRHPNCRNTGNYGTGAHWGQFSSGVISTTFSAVRGHFCPCTLRHRNMPYAQTPGRLDRRRGRGDHRVPLGVHRGCFFGDLCPAPEKTPSSLCFLCGKGRNRERMHCAPLEPGQKGERRA